MTKKHATYYTDADTRQSLIDIGMKAGAKEGRAASLGLRISAAYHERLIEALREITDIAEDLDISIFDERGSGKYPGLDNAIEARELLAEIEGAGK